MKQQGVGLIVAQYIITVNLFFIISLPYNENNIINQSFVITG